MSFPKELYEELFKKSEEHLERSKTRSFQELFNESKEIDQIKDKRRSFNKLFKSQLASELKRRTLRGVISKSFKYKTLKSQMEIRRGIAIDFLRNNNISGRGNFIILGQNGELLYHQIWNIPITEFRNKWFKNEGYRIGWMNSTNYVWDELPNFKFIWSPNINIESRQVSQYFKLNELNNCFFKSIRQTIISKQHMAKNKGTKANHQTILNKIDGLQSRFINGVPESKIQDICDTLKINVEINNIFNQTWKKWTIGRHSTCTVKMINNKFDHVEINSYEECDYGNNIIDLHSEEEFKDKQIQLKEDRQTFYWTKKNIYCMDGHTYRYIDPLDQLIDDWFSKYNLSIFKMTDKNDAKYFKENCANYSTHAYFRDPKEGERLFEPDIKKAYTKFKDCDYYMKFPTIMTGWFEINSFDQDLDCFNKVGFWLVHVDDMNVSENTRKIMNTLGLVKNNLTCFETPMINFMKDLGYSFVYKFGNYCWKTCEFDFLEKDGAYKKGNSDVSMYSKISGALNCLCDESTINTHCIDKLAEQFMMEDADGYEIVFNNEANVASIINTHKTANYGGHIGSYITCYCRISNIKALIEYDYDDIICFKLDSFVVNCDKPLQKNFIYKDENIKLISHGCTSGLFMTDVTEPKICEGHVQYHDRIQLQFGPGGTGKTHHTLSANKNVVFASAMWRLSVEKSREYAHNNVIGISVNHLIGANNCNAYLIKNKPPSKIFIDEVNQIDKSWIDSAITLYPYSQIFIAGDLIYDKESNKFDYYQCPFPRARVIDMIEDAGIRVFTTNYRVKDDQQLLDNLNLIRDKMKEFNFEHKRINKYVEKMYKHKIISYEDVKSQYNYKTDYILSSTKIQNDLITEQINGNKWKCIRHGHDDILKKIYGNPNIFLQGEYVVDPSEELSSVKWERKDSDTIHSCQGITIRHPGKLYINIARMFCSRQMYTAISRVQHSDQLIFFKME